ncbi:Pdr8p TDEL_0G04100 [Torulaspora delbrueckii]|uniref:Zn(2)-C6 fungal-type domain-containing protein n=1 Tax=Torulaspora delbrueckii TaxID=4950 RepID=G8ZY10_TORDE|nr:hypothetical protein TDEL_0G04100 [Torulaspora delbrueckii]CCE93777.1 hypothetical protein TDEL_0G04100 [Torulaspora delbrueckii]
MAEDAKLRKRRRKIVRSCTFCRRRKLKCDHAKPMCNQCLERKLPNCLYTDDFNFQLTTDELFSDSPNVELIRRVKELESKLAIKFGCDKPRSCANNPLWGYRTFIQDQSQKIIFGPTSWRTTVIAQGERFQSEYKKLWEVILPERDRWIREQCASPLETVMRTKDNDSLVNEVCKQLPSFSEIKSFVVRFFSDDYHDMFRVLDREKTLQDLEVGFVRSVDDPNRVVKLIDPEGDGNFFKVALILWILNLLKYDDNTPPIFLKFFLSLNGLGTASRFNFFERAQLLVLRFLSKIYSSYVCIGTSQLSSLVAELVECSLSLGLATVDWCYKDQEHLVGPLWTLKNVWFWTLYADVMVSFEIGKPLLISDDHFDPELLANYPHDSSGLLLRRRTMLLEFLRASRICMREINHRTTSGDIGSAIDRLITFLNEQMLPIQYYTSLDKIRTVDFFDVIVLAPTLGMLQNFHNIQRTGLKLKTTSVTNGLVKFGLLSLSLCVNTILGVFDRDQHTDGGKAALNIALLLVNPLLMRVVSEIHAAFFHKISLFEKGLLKINDSKEPIELETLEMPKDQYYSFTASIEKFREITDQLLNPANEEVQKAFTKSYSITTTLALESLSRNLFDIGRQSREMAENYCNFDDKSTISQDMLDQMTEIFWSTYEQQSQDLWSVKPQGFHGFQHESLDFDGTVPSENGTVDLDGDI